MTDKRRRAIERLWESYRTMVVPADASETQIRETRQAFFAGAAILFEGILQNLSSSEDEITEADMTLMADVQAEIDEFGQQLDLRYLRSVSGLN